MTMKKKLPINEIICDDSVKTIETFPPNSIDLTLSSPPYGDLRDYKGYQFNFKPLAKQLYRVTKPGGVVVWVEGDQTTKGSESGESFEQALYFKKECGFKLHDTMIYKSDCFANPSTNRYHQIFQFMFVFVKGKLKTFNPIKDKLNKSYGKYTFGKSRRQKDGTMKNHNADERIDVKKYGMRFNIWEYNTGYGNCTPDLEAHQHPAIFPDKLAEDHILSWSNKGDIVLDPMGGAGTSAKMAKLNGRKYINIDCSKEYCKLAKLLIGRANPIVYRETNKEQVLKHTKDLGMFLK